MAQKRLFFCVIILAICYFVGVTWADVQNNSSKIAPETKNNNVIKVSPTINTPTSVAPQVIVPPTTNGTTDNHNNVPECTCDSTLVPRLNANGTELEICAKCKCHHEARNTTLIRVVVIIVIWIISILVIYMLFLMCLDPLLNKRVKANYQEHTNEDDDATSNSPPLPSSTNHELNSRANVLNRVGHQQDKWKRQVREQRRHIYDRRTMLN